MLVDLYNTQARSNLLPLNYRTYAYEINIYFEFWTGINYNLFLYILNDKTATLIISINSAAVGLRLRRLRLKRVPNTARRVHTSTGRLFIHVRFQNYFLSLFSRQKQRSVRKIFLNTTAMFTTKQSKIWSAFKFRL